MCERNADACNGQNRTVFEHLVQVSVGEEIRAVGDAQLAELVLHNSQSNGRLQSRADTLHTANKPLCTADKRGSPPA